MTDEDLPPAEALVGNGGPGRYFYEIYRHLVELPIPTRRPALARHLLEAQRAGDLRFHRRRWSIRADDEEDGRTTVEISSAARVAPNGRFLEAIPADVLPGDPLPLTVDDTGVDGSAPEGWDLLRRLLPHYDNCLRLGSASRISQHLDRHHEQFEILQPRGRWWPDGAGSRTLRIDRRNLSESFLQGLHQRQTDPILLGYPVSVTLARDDNVFIDPAAVYTCTWQIDDTALLLWPNEQAPALNPDWLQRRRDLRRMRDTALWLRQTGDLTAHALQDNEAWVDLPDLLQSLRTQGSLPMSGPLDPAQLRPRLDLGLNGALQNTAGLFLTGQSPYSRGARRDLQALATWTDENWARTSLSGLFMPDTTAALRDPVPVVAPLPLSESQYMAVRDGLSQPLTLVSGPPGTGKSQVVVALMASAAAAGRSVLFASHRHQAIDAVQSRFETLCGDLPMLARAYSGTADDSFSFESAIDAVIGRHVGAEARQKLEHRFDAVTKTGRAIDTMLGHLARHQEIGDTLSILHAEMIRRESASQIVPRIPRRSPIVLILALLRRLLFIRRQPEPRLQPGDEGSLSGLGNAALKHRLAHTEIRHRESRRVLDSRTADDALPEMIARLTRESERLFPVLIDFLHACSQEDAGQLADLRGNLVLARGLEERRALWDEQAHLVLRYFPLWACSTLAVGTRIPLAPALFDYLVIDEATTSDIATALPLFARARQAIIVGDRQQTKMISDLAPAREAELRRRAGLTHSSLGRFAQTAASLFDLAWTSHAASRHMLRDHFRCHPEMASYCSDTFYEGRLLVRTDEATLKPPPGQKAGLHWSNVVGPLERCGRGCRSHAEAQALVDHLERLVGDDSYSGSVGVIAPFKRQVELLTHMIEQRLSRAQIDRLSLRVGTSHEFQGDDKDVVLVSLCYGPDMPRGASWFLRQSRELFNVAISRARAVCHVFGNREAALNSGLPHLHRLAQRIGSEGAPQADPRSLFESPWEERLHDALQKAGIASRPQYRLAGRRLDLAVIEGDRKLDIEVDGDTYHRDPDGFRKVSDLWRDHVIGLMGWQVRRFWVYELRDDMEACVELVRQDLGR